MELDHWILDDEATIQKSHGRVFTLHLYLCVAMGVRDGIHMFVGGKWNQHRYMVATGCYWVMSWIGSEETWPQWLNFVESTNG